MLITIRILIISSILVAIDADEDVCYKENCQENEDLFKFRYLLYDINPPEGFNLRRDVYMRMAVLAHKLKFSKNPNLNNFKLILPPWSHLIHWGYSETPEYIPWSTFFDLDSLQKFAPVIELYDYFQRLKLNKYTRTIIDSVYILQHYEDMFKSGKFEDKWSIEKCIKPSKLRYFHYSNITSHNVECLSFHGASTNLMEVLKKDPARSIMFEHAEVALHDSYGSKLYWQARRSMRFNRELREIANQFRKAFLNSSDTKDNTFLDSDWQNDKPKRSANGGPYLAVHLRRRDFLKSRSDQIPDLESAAEQIAKNLKELHLIKVFIATDASQHEFKELRKKLASQQFEVYKFVAPNLKDIKFSPGGIAIIDQIICSYARYFIGTHESTFSFRIYEEREILGFPTKTTFNIFCKDSTNDCDKKPSIWKIVY